MEPSDLDAEALDFLTNIAFQTKDTSDNGLEGSVAAEDTSSLSESLDMNYRYPGLVVDSFREVFLRQLSLDIHAKDMPSLLSRISFILPHANSASDTGLESQGVGKPLYTEHHPANQSTDDLARETGPVRRLDEPGNVSFKASIMPAADKRRDDEYNPTVFDDPSLIFGKHRTVLRFSGSIVSILPFMKKKDRKAAHNEHFGKLYSALDSALTFSKVQGVKEKMLDVSQCGDFLEVSTVALAYVFFEKLVLKGVVSLAARKDVGAACLLLASKYSEPKFTSVKIQQFFKAVLTYMGVSKRSVLSIELGVWAALDFYVHIPLYQVYSHVAKILEVLERPGPDYFGPQAFEIFYSKRLARLQEREEEDEFGYGNRETTQDREREETGRDGPGSSSDEAHESAIDSGGSHERSAFPLDSDLEPVSVALKSPHRPASAEPV